MEELVEVRKVREIMESGLGGPTPLWKDIVNSVYRINGTENDKK
jgi:hypothetical protein